MTPRSDVTLRLGRDATSGFAVRAGMLVSERGSRRTKASSKRVSQRRSSVQQDQAVCF